jgi:hypothetical protein
METQDEPMLQRNVRKWQEAMPPRYPQHHANVDATKELFLLFDLQILDLVIV